MRTIVSADNGTEFIRPYYDEGIIIIASPHVIPTQFNIINFNEPLKQKYFNAVYADGYTYSDSTLFDIPNKGLFCGTDLMSDDYKQKLAGINLSTMQQEELSWDVYKFAKAYGAPGGAVPGTDCVDALYPKPDKSMVTSQGGIMVELGWQLPEYIHITPADCEKKSINSAFMFVNNNDMRAIAFKKDFFENLNGIGKCLYHVFDKKNSQWHSVDLQGGDTFVRGFSCWLAGYVADVERGIPSPGKSDRRAMIAATGAPVDAYFKDARIYCPGILFLYNIRTKKKYTIQTNQGDSEVLLIDNNSVYYRVNNALYKAAIDENVIGPATLLVKGDMVPDIHWAFMGPSYSKKASTDNATK